MNLAINARDAMPNGGRLEITADNIHVDESLVRQNHALCPGPHVLLTVVDNGIGMTQEIMDRIFDPFFTTKEQGKGTGLGLATTLGIVRSHGGEINVYSERGNGTSFSIYLPSSQVPVGAIIESRDGNGVQRGNGETILVVDDDALIVETACATLETGGYGALAAAGGAEGLSTYLRQSDLIDLVLLDMMMPGMDGVTAKERLRAINPDVCIVASSGLRRPRDAGERMADVDGFLPKPYSDDQLLELVRKVLDKKRETTGFK